MIGVGAAIAGVAMALPGRLISNEEIAAVLGVDANWIAKRTGTRERPWAAAGDRLSQLAADAGRVALERAGVDPRALDLVLVATSTADEIAPNAAPLVAALGRADPAARGSLGRASDPSEPRRSHPHGGPGILPRGSDVDGPGDHGGAR